MDEFNINLSGSNGVQKKKDKKEKEFEFNEEVSLFTPSPLATLPKGSCPLAASLRGQGWGEGFDGIEIAGADVKPPEPGKVFEIPVKGKESEFVSSLNKEDKELFIRAMDFVLKSAEKELNNAKKKNGAVSGGWNLFKNLTGMEFGSDNIQDRINKLKIQVEQVKEGKLSLTSLYKEVTGNELNEKEIANILNSRDFSNAKSLQDVQGFKEGQKLSAETIPAISSALASFGINAATGGTAGLIQLFSAAFLGYIAPSSIEHASDNDGYTKEEIKQDLAKGTASGIVNASGIKAFNAAKPILGAQIMGTGNAVSNQAIDQLLKDGKLDIGALTETAAVTGIAAFAAMYTAANVSNVIRPLLTKGNEMLPNILGRLASSAASGAAAGSAAAASAGSSKYIIDKLKNGEEIKLDELINAAAENIPNGALAGAGFGAVFEGIQIAGGIKAPKGAVRYEDIKTDEGIKTRNYYDKDGNILASDMKAKDVLKFMREKAPDAPDIFKEGSETALTEYNDVQKFDARTLRMTYSRSTKGLELYSWSDKGFRFETANLEPAPEIGAGKNTAIVKAENTSGKNPFNSNNSSNNGTKSLPQGTLALPEGNPSARTMQAKYGGDIVTNDGVISNNGGTPSPSLPGGEGGLPAPNPFENALPVEPPINTNGSEITAGASANTANGINTPKAGLNAEQPQSPHRTVKTEEAPEIEIKTAPENTKPAPVKPENNQNTGNAGSGTNAAGVNEPSAHNPSGGGGNNANPASEVQIDSSNQTSGIVSCALANKKLPAAAQADNKEIRSDRLTIGGSNGMPQTNDAINLEYLLENSSSIIENRIVWIPKSGGGVSLASAANYLSSKLGGNIKNGYVILADDAFFKEYRTNTKFKTEVDEHLEQYPETKIYDFRSNTSENIMIAGKKLIPKHSISSAASKTNLLDQDLKLNADALQKIDNLIDDMLISEKSRTLVKNFLRENIVIDTYKSEIAIMHQLKSKIESKGIGIKDSNTYYIVPREWGTVPKSGDRISYTFAMEMGIDPSHLITDVSKIPEQANIICLDDFAGSGNSLISFAAALSNCNAKSVIIAPLTASKGLNKYWTETGNLDIDKLLHDWSLSKEHQDTIISRMQSHEKLTIAEMYSSERDSAKRILLEEILSKTDPDEKLLKNLENLPLMYISGRNIPNIYASEYFNSLSPDEQNILLNAAGFSSAASILGYGQSGTTYIGPIMATNTNLGIMYKISELLGIKAKDAEIKTGSMKIKASDFGNFRNRTEQTGAFIYEGDLINGTKNYLEYNGMKYELSSKLETRAYQIDGRTFIAEYDGKTSKLYETTDGKHEFIQNLSPNRDSIPKIQVDGKKKPVNLIPYLSSAAELVYNNGDKKLILSFTDNSLHIYNPDNELETYNVKKIETGTPKRHIWQIN